uniref:hypothetical protein n=1 Tax=Thauera sp. SDU_THAU2 TaxID=3136633 RepID=UPI00311E46C1
MEIGRRLALGNVAGAIHPHEEERHAARIRPLQRRQAVADGLEADAEAPAEAVDVVAQLLRRGQEAAVGQHQCAGEVVGQADARQHPGLVAAERRLGGDAVDVLPRLQKSELGRHLESLLAGFEQRRQAQHARHRIERTQRAVLVALFAKAGVVAHHAHAMHVRQPRRQPGSDVARLQRPGIEQALGEIIQFGDVVVPGVEEIAHFLVRHRWRTDDRAAILTQAGGKRIDTLLGLPAAPVERDQGAADGRHAGGQLADVGQRHRFVQHRAERAAAEHFAQVGDQPSLVVIGKALHIHVQCSADLQQHLHGERTLVLFDLIQVAGRNLQRPRQRHLGQSALFAQPAQTRAHEGLFHAGSDNKAPLIRKIRKPGLINSQKYTKSIAYITFLLHIFANHRRTTPFASERLQPRQ